MKWPIVEMERIATLKLMAQPGNPPIPETLLSSQLTTRDSVAPPLDM
ncbi:hypothetical protein ACRAQ7_06450 [Erythrobacter sp. W53]